MPSLYVKILISVIEKKLNENNVEFDFKMGTVLVIFSFFCTDNEHGITFAAISLIPAALSLISAELSPIHVGLSPIPVALSRSLRQSAMPRCRSLSDSLNNVKHC